MGTNRDRRTDRRHMGDAMTCAEGISGAALIVFVFAVLYRASRNA